MGTNWLIVLTLDVEWTISEGISFSWQRNIHEIIVIFWW